MPVCGLLLPRRPRPKPKEGAFEPERTTPMALIFPITHSMSAI
jgi:hypothetical protein